MLYGVGSHDPLTFPAAVATLAMVGAAAGALTLVRSDLRLALDVDTPADLAALQSSHPGPHTAAILASLALV